MHAIYLRLSQEDEESNSIDNQLREGKAFAEENSLKPYVIYNEGEGISGKSDIKKRPQLHKLLDDIENGNIKTVWARNQNRVERNRYTFAKFLKTLTDNKARLFFNNKEYDLKDPSVKLQMGILSDINEYIIDNQGYQTKKSLLDNVLEGKAHGKTTPLGYGKDKEGYLIIDENERHIVKKIYQMCLEGKGSTTIRHYLNDNNIPTRYKKQKDTIEDKKKYKSTFKVKNKYTGKVTYKKKSNVIWSDTQVQQILKNPMYKGKRRWNDVLIDCPAIFTDFEWQKVQEQYKNNSSSKNTGKKVDHKYLLKGLIECGICERNYYGRSRTNKRDHYYVCSSKRYQNLNCGNRAINIDVLDSFIWETMFKGDTLYKKMAETFKDGGTEMRRNQLKKNLKENETKLTALKNEYSKTIDLVVKGLVDESEILKSKRRVAQQTNTINEIIDKDKEEYRRLENESKTLNDLDIDFGYLEQPVLNENPDLKNKLISVKTQRQRKNNFKPSWNEKKELLHKYIKRIFVEFDKENRIYLILISYNLSIEDETYLMDSNYMYGYSLNSKEFTKWFYENGRNYTPKKWKETKNKLESYYA